MGIPMRVGNEIIYSSIKNTATAGYRSIPNQIGKYALENPDLPIKFLRDVLIAKNQDRSLAEPFIFNKKND